MTKSDRVLLGVLLLDTVLLAILELFFLPLRLDGKLLPKLGDVPMPLTVLVAILTTPLLVKQAATLHRRAAFAPLVVWVVTIVVLGLMGPGGDLVLVQDWRALLLIAGGTLPAALVLGSSLAVPGKAAPGKTVTGKK